jgi:hypothetical protein
MVTLPIPAPVARFHEHNCSAEHERLTIRTLRIIPTCHRRNQPELDALKEATAKLEAMMSEMGVSEEDVVADFKLRRADDK